MCLLIASPSGLIITPEEFYTANDNNPHGIGISWHDGNGIQTFKSLNVDDALAEYMAIAGNPHILHFRWGTSGKQDLSNVHPFTDKNGLISFAHNGVLPWRSTKDKSDTHMFFLDIIRHNIKNIDDMGFQDSIEELIGVGNKFAFLKACGNITIYNENSGYWEDERNIWFSNTSHLRTKFSTFGKIEKEDTYDYFRDDELWEKYCQD